MFKNYGVLKLSFLSCFDSELKLFTQLEMYMQIKFLKD